MASSKIKAIVLKSNNIKEKDKQVILYTLEEGKMIVSMRGVRNDKAKLKAGKEIFCFGEFVIEKGKNCNIVTAVDIIDNFYSLSSNIDKYYEGCVILDILDKIGLEPNPQLFIEAIKALKTLCYEDVKKYYVIDKFFVDIFKSLGFDFLSNKCSSCHSTLGSKYLNLDIGELVCPACKTASCVQISDACYGALRIFESTDYDKLASVKLGGMGEVQAYNILNTNFEWRLGINLIKLI